MEATPHRAPLRSSLLRVLCPLLLVLAAAFLHLAARRMERIAESPYPIARTAAYRPGMSRLALDGVGDPSGALSGSLPVTFAFEPGDTLGGVLDELGFAPDDAVRIVSQVERFADPRKLKVGDSYGALIEDEVAPAGFVLTLAGQGRVRIERDGGAWSGSFREFTRSRALRAVHGRLDGALETAVVASGGDALAAYLLAEVFQWDLDFNRDLRLGDEFEVLYERVYLDGSFHSLGEVLAATYTNRGRRLEAYRYGDPPGYYDAEGRPMKKLFLRSPLRFSRITSRFSHSRFHPILKRSRPHWGVDYGAPTGTPVRVTANGVVRFAGWDGGGGRTVKVRHPNGYETAYLHLSGFARGVRPGRRVTQGEVIGYVGATGLATGPHLDYRVRQEGRWIDPLRIKSIPTLPLADSLLPEFFARRDRLRAALAARGPGELAGESGAAVLASRDAAPADSASAGSL